MRGRHRFIGVLLVATMAAAFSARSARAATLTFPDLSLAVPDGRSADPGELITYFFGITNKSAAAMTIGVDWRSGSDWPVAGDAPEITLAPGEETVYPLSVIVPADAPAGAEDRLELILTYGSESVARAAVVTRVNARHDFDLTGPSPVTSSPGTAVNLAFVLTNVGNMPDAYECEAVSYNGWPLQGQKAGLSLAPFESGTVECVLEIPLRAAKGVSDFVTLTVRAKSTGATRKAAVRITAGAAQVEGEAAAGEANYLLYGELGLFYADPETFGGYPKAWLHLQGPLELGSWAEFFIAETALPAGMTLTDLLLSYRTDSYLIKLGEFGSPWSGMVNPGSPQAGLDLQYWWEGNQRVELTVGTPTTTTFSLDPAWYALAWSGRWPSWDMTVRLLQTEMGPNTEGPYLDVSVDRYGLETSFSADLAYGLGGDYGASLFYAWQGNRLGLRGGFSLMDGLNGDGRRYTLALGGDYRLSLIRRLGVDFGLTYGEAVGLNPGYLSGSAGLMLTLGPDLNLYASTSGTFLDLAGWVMDQAEYKLGLGYGLANPANPLRASLELLVMEKTGYGMGYNLAFTGEYRFNLDALRGDFLASLYGNVGIDPLLMKNAGLSLTYRDRALDDLLGYSLGLTLSYPGPLYALNAEMVWDINRDTTLSGRFLLTEEYLSFLLQLVRQFNLTLPRPHASVNVTVFQDLDNDGRRDANEPGIYGVGVTLDGRELGRTADGGRLVLTGVAPGNHTVDLDCSFDPALLPTAAPHRIAVKAGKNMNLDIPVIRLTLLTGYAYADKNGDRAYNDGDRLLPGLPVVLTKPDGGQATTTTGQNGGYAFADLLPGIYRVQLMQDGYPLDTEVTLPGPYEVVIAQEGVHTLDLVAQGKDKPVVVTFIASPTITAAAAPVEVVQGGTTTVKVVADMPLSRILIESGGRVFADCSVDDDNWSGTIKIPDDQPFGRLVLTIKAWDGGEGPGTTQLELLVVRPLVSPAIEASSLTSLPMPGQPLTIRVTADMVLSRVEVTVPGEEPQTFTAKGSEWTGAILVPPDQPPGLMTVRIRAWDGGDEPGACELLVKVGKYETLQQPEFAVPLRLRISFDFNSSRIKPDSYPMLNQIAEALKSHPNMGLKIVGHTDSIGSNEYNLKLSLARARSVKEYLVKKSGIDPNRIEIAGMGEEQPIADNETEKGRALNRRVEFVWLEIAVAGTDEDGEGTGAPGA
ncbi:MAG: OmpA family protein [Patescibacteria group bacterium]